MSDYQQLYGWRKIHNPEPVSLQFGEVKSATGFHTIEAFKRGHQICVVWLKNDVGLIGYEVQNIFRGECMFAEFYESTSEIFQQWITINGWSKIEATTQ